MKNQLQSYGIGTLCAVILLGWLAWRSFGQPVVYSPGSGGGGGGGGGGGVAGVSSFNSRDGGVILLKGDVAGLGALDNDTIGNAATASGSTNNAFSIQSQSGVAASLRFLSGGVDDWSLIINNHSNLLSGLTYVARNFQVTPAVPTYAGNMELNFNGQGSLWIMLEGDVTITSANLSAGRGLTVRFDAGASDRAINFPAWHFLAGGQAITLGAGKTGILSVVAYDTTEGNCVATWASE